MCVMRIPVRPRLAGLGAAVLLVLGSSAGCSSIEPDVSTSGSAPATEAQGADTASANPQEQGGSHTPAFGHPIEWDGLKVTVSQPVPFSPSSLASYPKGAERFVAVDITLENTSDELLQTMWFTTAATSGDLSGFVADSDKDIGAPTTGVQPGQSLTWKEAYPMSGSLRLDLTWQPADAEAQVATLTLDSYPTPSPTATSTGTATGEASGEATSTSEPSGEATTEITHVDPAE